MKTETKHFLLEKPRETGMMAAGKTMVRGLQAGYYRLLLTCARFDKRIRKTQEKKYKVAVCAIFKDEGEFFQEWLEYHLMIGVEHFYLYNNNSSDGYLEILKPYMDRGLVTLVDFPEEHAQMKAYADAIGKYAGETKWMGFIDLDEFVVPLEGKDIYSVLKPFDHRAGAVLIYWKNFGSSGLEERDPEKLVTEQFTASYPKYLDIGKCFYNTDFEFGGDIEGRNNVLHHVLWCRWKGQWIPPVNVQNKVAFLNHNRLNGKGLPVQLNHYKTKSRGDYVRNMQEKTDVFFAKNPRTLKEFEEINGRCTGEDTKIFRYIKELKKRVTVGDRGECGGGA